MTQSSIARIFLKLNSAFSALCGIVLLCAGGWLSPAIFVDPVDWAAIALRVLGAGLVGFAAMVFVTARSRFISRKSVHEIVVLDAIWVLGSIALISVWGSILSVFGFCVVAVIAAMVAIFAVGQFVGAAKIVDPLAQADVQLEDGNLIATVRRVVPAPADVAWAIMVDHPAYADVASNIAKVEVLAGDGLGMKRRCYGPKGENWEETCDLYEPGRAYGFKIDTTAADYPYPFAELRGRWSVRPLETGSEFDIRIVAKPKGSALSRWMFVQAAKAQFKTILIDLAEAWAARMERP